MINFILDIQIGFDSDQFFIKDGDLTKITVKLLNGSLEPGLPIPFTIRISIGMYTHERSMIFIIFQMGILLMMFHVSCHHLIPQVLLNLI